MKSKVGEQRTGARRSIAGAGLVLVVAMGVGVAACSGDGSDTKAATTTSPEERIVSDAEVVEGLADVRAIATRIVAQVGSDPAAAKQQVVAMYDRWFSFEGTVRKNDKDRYLQMEDGLNGIKVGVEKGDAGRAQRGMADLDQAADAYLGEHP